MKPTPAMRMGLSVAAATGLYGISFGALAVTAGLGFWQTLALSLLMFTGGSQFAFIGVLAGGGAGAAALGAASLLGVRNAVYGMQMQRLLGMRGWRRWLAAHLTIDESAATALAQQDGDEQRRGFWTAGLGVFALWNLCTALGAWLGDALGNPAQWGLDGAAVAAFLGLLWPRLQQREPLALALLAGCVTALAVPWLPPGLPILLAAALGVLWGWWQPGPQATPATPAAPAAPAAPVTPKGRG